MFDGVDILGAWLEENEAGGEGDGGTDVHPGLDLRKTRPESKDSSLRLAPSLRHPAAIGETAAAEDRSECTRS